MPINHEEVGDTDDLPQTVFKNLEHHLILSYSLYLSQVTVEFMLFLQMSTQHYP